MHMADALLTPAVGGTMYAVSAGALGYAAHKIRKDDLTDKKLPLMAVSGSFVFAAQMINFTIPATGSSGHICGGILLAGLLGGEPALLSIAAVLVIQCLLFADGGLLALGANIFNMGVIPCLIVYPLLMRPFLQKGISKKRIAAASILSCVIGLQLGAFSVVLETLASGVTELPFSTFVSLMQPIHLAIGFVEGLITVGVLIYVYSMRPEILESAASSEKLPLRVSIGRTVITLAILAALVGGGLSLYASSNPDGLEWAMERTAGTSELEREDGVHEAASRIQEQTSLLPDYDFADGEGTGTTASGLIGAAVTAALAAAAGGLLAATRKKGNFAS
ncbi:MAG: energy-coupling factor ABC transporter permease [Eubacteriales bacterium]|nr:energy-coupling factor ABC transporter permease [Eubacteriales bacterium]